jgi:hypothetical protein
MKKFILKISIFILLSLLCGELIVRYYKLVQDNPRRFVDSTGIQRYIPGQVGYSNRGKVKWKVNDYGWLGTAFAKKDTIISVIGDSFIENIKLIDSCHQGVILKPFFRNVGFFEAGRSGVTFIEACEITKLLDKEISPDYHLLYLNENDFKESISNIVRYTDRMQIDINSGEILNAELKSPGLKSILYNTKVMYYLYLRFPIFVSAQNKAVKKKELSINLEEKEKYDTIYEKLLETVVEKYEVERIIFVIHPSTRDKLIQIIHKWGIKTIILNAKGDENWTFGENDIHWTCYGNKQVAKQVRDGIKRVLYK